MSEKASYEQLTAFKDAARASVCDESEATFDAKLRRVATVKPKPAPEEKAGKGKAPE